MVMMEVVLWWLSVVNRTEWVIILPKSHSQLLVELELGPGFLTDINVHPTLA